ncbi:MAG: cell wall-binding repeat-containing protein, partial [Coriobacteriia bacterium]|nr:cell wall-binding repeat-containing protein [Coriobacteriia bacterium]
MAFQSGSTNLVPDDTNDCGDVFVHDRETGETTRVSVSSEGTEGDECATHPAISGDGKHVAFGSAATNIHADADSGNKNVYMRDLETNELILVSCMNGEDGDDCSNRAGISDDGTVVAFQSSANNFEGPTDSGYEDIFIATLFDDAVVEDVKHVERLSSGSRYTTAVKIAREGFDADPGMAGTQWDGVKHVVIASGEDRAVADPPSAAGLCWAYDAPLFLVSSTRVEAEVERAIGEIANQNGSVTVHIVGGTTSVPNARFTELDAAVAGTLVKDRVVAAGTRYDLAAGVARRMRTVSGTAPDTVLVANGADPKKLFDALALS